MVGDAKASRPEALDRVTLRTLAFVASYKLTLVLVVMTVYAEFELELLEALWSRSALGMTGHTLGRLVFPEQGIASFGVIRFAHLFGKPNPLNRSVTGLAVSSKLGQVHGLVAACASRALPGLLHLPATMTLGAGNLAVTIAKAEPRMTPAKLIDLFPVRHDVTTLACRLAQPSFVGVLVTILAIREGNAPPLQRCAVTLGAVNGNMLALQRITSQVMIEILDVFDFPIAIAVAV